MCQSEDTFDPATFDIHEEEIVGVDVANGDDDEDDDMDTERNDDDRFFFLSLDQICQLKYRGLCTALCVSVAFECLSLCQSNVVEELPFFAGDDKF